MHRRAAAIAAFVLAAGCSSQSPGPGTSGTSAGFGGGAGTTGSGATTGTTGGGGTSGNGGAAYAEFCETYDSALCAYAHGCGILDPAVACSTLYPTGSCDAGPLDYDSQAARACLASLPSGAAASSCSVDGFLSFYIVIADAGVPCMETLQPPVPEGGGCDSSAECVQRPDAGSVSCHFAPGTCAGTCLAFVPEGAACSDGTCVPGSSCNYLVDPAVCAPYVSVGSPCEGTQSGACDPATGYCDFSPDGGSRLIDGGFGAYLVENCLALAPVGSPCGSGRCAAGGYCGSPDGGFEGLTCLAQAAAGEACPDNADFGSACLSGLACLDGVCSPLTASLGDRCGSGGDAFVECSQGFCRTADDGGPSTCQAGLAEGAACEVDVDTCQENLVCFQGSCTAGSVGLGSTCGRVGFTSVSCSTGYCSNADGGLGTCLTTVPTGQSCTFSAQCVFPDLCVSRSCVPPPTAGQACGLPGPFFEGCAEGDSCIDGGCVLAPTLGQACTITPDTNPCQVGHCDPTGHCANYLSPGSPCDPTLEECGNGTVEMVLADGGFGSLDSQCLPPMDGGGPVCTVPCY